MIAARHRIAIIGAGHSCLKFRHHDVTIRTAAKCFVFLALAHLAFPQDATVDQLVVKADRLPETLTNTPFEVQVLDSDALQNAPQLTLDDILRAQVPGFSLFRRNDSRTANPTTQGVTLRNFGPSGAGRTLVLLDGIPLNDPFAGYVLWSQVPASAIDSVVVQPGGGAGLFGNAALAGTIYLVSPPISSNSATAGASVGNYDTYELNAAGSVTHGPVAMSVFVERFATSGYPVLRADQRGPVDNTASANSDLFAFRSEWQVDQRNSIRLDLRHFDDDRGNGTTYTRNSSLGTDASATWRSEFPQESAELQVSLYGQLRDFESTFSSINASRTVETPALDQFDVPAHAIGGSAVWSMTVAGDHRLTLGADYRWLQGETNEDFLWDGTEFTKQRRAGGKQSFAGTFAEDTWTPSDNLTLLGSLRYDHWALFDGSRKEWSRLTGTVTLDSQFPDRSGDEINGRIGLNTKLSKAVTVRGAFYSGFRVPTLNELYRPFRVGNDVTEANPALKPERLLAGEIGIDLRPTKILTFSGTAFLNYLEDAVGNVTIGAGPGTFNPGGFIPVGGTLRQRQNIDLVVAPGFEATVTWQVHDSLRLRASYIFTKPKVEEAADPSLEGKLLAQTPENVFTAAIDWTPAARWRLTAEARWVDRQFEDDQNSRVLAPFTTVDAALSYDFSAHLSAALRVENLFNEQVETGRSADGLVSIGAPRLVAVALRWQL